MWSSTGTVWAKGKRERIWVDGIKKQRNDLTLIRRRETALLSSNLSTSCQTLS